MVFSVPSVRLAQYRATNAEAKPEMNNPIANDPRQKKSLRYDFAITFFISAALSFAASAFCAEEFPVTITIDGSKPLGPLRPIWRFFGYDEPNFTYMKDGRKLLKELSELGAEQVYIRCHHLLTSGDGSPALKWGSTGIYREDTQGNPIYDWTIVDRIFDTYRQTGLKPYAQLGFMPKSLTIHPQDYPENPPRHARVPVGVGYSYPPKDYAKWGELCCQWAKHCVERYGRSEVERWYWEVWNEPNIFYFKAPPTEYHKLYDFAVDGVRRALPTARVGGPHTAGGPGGKFLGDFLTHCVQGTNYATGKHGSPLDFIAFHAKGNPKVVDGHVRMGISSQLRNINDGFAVVRSFPELQDKPIILGESDPEGCAACPSSEFPNNGYRNTELYAAYTAASFVRKHDLAARHGVNLEGAVTWAFEFEDEPYFAGFRVLASNGLDLPVLNTFRMFGKMGGQRLTLQSSEATTLDVLLKEGVPSNPDVSGLAALKGNVLSLMVWHYHDDNVPGSPAAVEITISGLPVESGKARVTEYRIDHEHSNSYEAWKSMGSPAQPTPEQYARLEKAGQLATLADPKRVAIDGGHVTLHCSLPRLAVSLFVLELDGGK